MVLVTIEIESPPQLNEFIANGVITPEGRIAHQLALSDHIIKNNNDPDSLFSINSDLLLEHYEIRDRNLYQLGIYEADPSERIGEIKRILTEGNFPIYKKLTDKGTVIQLHPDEPFAVPLAGSTAK